MNAMGFSFIRKCISQLVKFSQVSQTSKEYKNVWYVYVYVGKWQVKRTS